MFEVWNGALSLTFGILVVWVAYRYAPEVREILRALPNLHPLAQDDTWVVLGSR